MTDLLRSYCKLNVIPNYILLAIIKLLPYHTLLICLTALESIYLTMLRFYYSSLVKYILPDFV
jgi:hypothetical protein